jgi:phosphonate transport system substrate-binding protein
LNRALLLALVLACAAHAETEAPRPLTLAAAGYLKSDPRFKMSAQPLVEYLSEGLKRPVRLKLYPGYNDVLVQLGSGEIDLAILPPIVNLQAHDADLAKPLAYGVYPSGTYTYRAYLLARKADPKVQSVRDLTGRKIAFVDLYSASGYVYPKLLLSENGVDPKSVVDVFRGNHVAALQALDAGEVDAAAVYELLWQSKSAAVKPLSRYRVLATTDPIPAEAIAATPRLDPAIAAQVQKLLLSFYHRRNEKKAWRDGRYAGFIPADPFVLAGVRDAYRRLVPESR